MPHPLSTFKPPKVEKPERFIIASENMAGLGFAKILQDEGKDVILVHKYKPEDTPEDDEERFNLCGEGVVPKEELDKIFKERAKYRDALWIWTENHNPEMADQLRSEGFLVIGGHQLSDKMEHDRAFGVEIAKKAGLSIPPTFEFSSIQEGLDYLESHPDIAYVFKPDDPNPSMAWDTTAPDNERDEKANEEIHRFLESMPEGLGNYILQERKKGLEINCEMWVYKGTPIFAFCNFECKKKLNHDMGKFVGCAHDIGFIVPLNCRIVQDTVAKVAALPEFKTHTGFIDINVIVADREYWFLEWCHRFGYNAHPNLFMNLAIDPFSEIMVDLAMGNIKDFEQHFRKGFGASITAYGDNLVKGLPVIIDETIDDKCYHFNTYLEDELYKTAGYGDEMAIVCGFDYDIKSASEEVLRNLDKIHFPNRSARTDLAQTDYSMNPTERWIAGEAFRLFDKKEHGNS